MNILLLDTDSAWRRQWQARLKTVGVEVSSHDSAEKAIAAHRSHFTLALCDFRGAKPAWADDLAATLQSLRSHSQSIIGVVDRKDSDDLANAFEVGFDDVLFNDCGDGELTTQLRRAEELQQLHVRLAQSQKLESIGELAAGIAHEINTPIQYVGDNTRFVQGACNDLTGILECCQKLIATEVSEDESVKTTSELRALIEEADVEYLLEEIPTAITQTLEGVDRVTNIVRAMKEFAHPGVSEMTLFDLAKSIENTVMVARNEWKYVAELVTEFDPELPPVPCLPGELNQVLLNMIVNAAHAITDALGDSPEDKGYITITTQLATPFAEIRIADTGNGIAKENLERIFAPFFTTKGVGKGTGQGLAIAHSVIVEKHGGTIAVESEVGRGTTFIIRIPLEQQNLEESSESPQLESVLNA